LLADINNFKSHVTRFLATFRELPEFDMERLLVAWQEAVFELYLAEEKIEPEVVEICGVGRTAVSVSISRCFYRRAIRRVSSGSAAELSDPLAARFSG